MDNRSMYEFAMGQIVWHEKQNDFARSQIEFCNGQLKRTRKEDKELKAFALERYPDDPITQSIYAGNYVGRETRKYINERAKWYRDIKYNNKWIAHYKKEAEYYERYIG